MAPVPTGSGPEELEAHCGEATSPIAPTLTFGAGVVSGGRSRTGAVGTVAAPTVAGIDKSLRAAEPVSFGVGLVARATSVADNVPSAPLSVLPFTSAFRPIRARRARPPTIADPPGEGFGRFATSKPAAACSAGSATGACGLGPELSPEDVAAAGTSPSA